MIWLTWRQFRTQAMVAALATGGLAVYLVVLGRSIRSAARTQLVDCGSAQLCAAADRAFRLHYKTPITLLETVLILVPALIGAFWGAPLIAHELETGTHRLVWSQSVTRRRWLLVKLGIVAAVALLVTAALSLLLTWTARPFDDRVGSRFGALAFASRDLAPLGYTLFALALGMTIGLLGRRTLPALAVTVAVFAAAQLVMPFLIRPHLMSPTAASVPVNATTLGRITIFDYDDTTLRIQGYNVPGAWMTDSSDVVRDSAGHPATGSAVRTCMQIGDGGPEVAGSCLAKLDLHFDVAYQPAGRYWAFQGIETGLFGAAGLALAGFSGWRIRRGLA